MKYPGVPRIKDKRIKLSLKQIAKIRALYAAGGFSHRRLAKQFGVSNTLIRYYVVDSDTRSAINKRRYSLIAARVAEDPEYAEKRRKQKIQNTIDLMKRTEKLKEFKGKTTYKWKKGKYHGDEAFRDKTRKQAREHYHRTKRLTFNNVL